MEVSHSFQLIWLSSVVEFHTFCVLAWTTWVMETLSASALSRCAQTPKIYRWRGRLWASIKPTLGWVGWRSFRWEGWGDVREQEGGREGGREGGLDGGLRWIKRGRECSSPLWGVLGTFMSVWRAGDPVRGARESVNSCCPVLRVSWESSSPVAVMGFRAVLLSLLLVSLSLTRGAVITGVSETNLVKSFSVFFICKLDSCLICF